MKLTRTEQSLLIDLIQAKIAEFDRLMALDPAAKLAWEQEIEVSRSLLEKVKQEVME
jgi:hypothetical protein